MTNKIYTISVEVANEPSAVLSLNANRTATRGPLKVIARSGALYQLTEAATGFAPQQIQVRRKGKDLQISLEQNSPDRPDLIIENYFGVNNVMVVGQAENGQHYPFIPDTAREIHAIDKLADGSTITQVLGGQIDSVRVAVEAAEPVELVETASAATGSNLLLLGAGGLTAAIAGGGGGGGTDANPTVIVGVFDNNGLVNNSEKTAVLVSGGSSNTPGGTIELIVIDKDGSEVARKTVPVARDGSWSTTVDVSNATDGTLTAKVVARTTSGIESTEASKDTIKDTAEYKIEITHNAEALAGADGVLNISEANNGVIFSINFESPMHTLTVDELQVTGGTARASTLKSNLDHTVWTVVVDPTPSNSGSMNLTLMSQKLAALNDAAGNPAVVTLADPVAYDILAPVVTFIDSGPNSGDSTDLSLDGIPIFMLDGNDIANSPSYTIGLAKNFDNDQITGVSFEGSGAVSLTNQNKVTLNLVGATAQDGLLALQQGFYTLQVAAVDDAGNVSVSRQIIGKNIGDFSSGRFVSVLGTDNSITGDSNSNFVINRVGVHEVITLGGTVDYDKVFFLKTGLGQVGAADHATIKDFSTARDTLRLDDLFSGSATHNHMGFESLDLDNNGTMESTRIFVNITGGLNRGDLAGTAEQIITLEKVQVAIPNPLLPFVTPAWMVL